MAMLYNYALITADAPEELAQKCTTALREGFAPAGGPILMPGPVAPALKLAQAMYRVIEISDEQAKQMQRPHLVGTVS